MKDLIVCVLAMILAAGCNTADNGKSSSIRAGLYEQQAQRTEVGGEPFSASPVGGYFQKSYRFFEGDTLRIEVKSDIPSENGIARAEYAVSGQKLSVTIKSSTTSYFETGSTLTFESFETVDEDYRETLTNGSESYIFEGPGLLLHHQNPDSDDLDKDGDTSEIVLKTEFYQYVVRYD